MSDSPTGPGDRPRISFLSSAYGTEDVVAKMIDSVRAQTHPDWELVVVDNGMSDEMARIVDGYSAHDPRIRLVRQPNRGAAGGINAAFAASRGRYVSVLHSDDRVEPEFCEILGGLLDRRPDVDAVTPDAWFHDAETGTRFRRSYIEDWGAPRPDPYHRVTLAELIEGLCPYYTGAVRREVWRRHGEFTPEWAKVNDVLVFLRMVAAGHTLVQVPERLADYCYAAESTSRGSRSEIETEVQREALVTEYAEASGAPEDLAALGRELARSRHRREMVSARMCLLDGDVVGARVHCDRALEQRRDARTLLIRAGLALAPGVTRSVYLRQSPSSAMSIPSAGSHVPQA